MQTSNLLLDPAEVFAPDIYCCTEFQGLTLHWRQVQGLEVHARSCKKSLALISFFAKGSMNWVNSLKVIYKKMFSTIKDFVTYA